MPQETGGRVRYGLLLLAVVLSVAVQGIVEPGPVQQVVVTARAGASLVLAFHAAQLRVRPRPGLVDRRQVVAAIGRTIASPAPSRRGSGTST